MYNRNTAHNNLDYKRQLRDARIDQNGIIIDVIVPNVRNVDAYGDLVYADTAETTTYQTSVIPQYSQWRMLIDVLGFSIENPIPLEILVRTDFDYPRGTKLVIPIDDQYKEWKVLSAGFKHIDRMQTKSVKVVPWRYVESIEEARTEPEVSPTAEIDKLKQGYDFT